jgi:AcrR family transcriptional regulator
MPRRVDPEVEGRILQAARKLWHKGGEKALSMRAIAEAAGTNTPAVYRRFRNREQILRALVASYQRELFTTLEKCQSIAEVVNRYLDFALARPREHQLVMSGLLPRMVKERPNLDLVMQQSSKWLGGRPGDYQGLIFLLAAMVDGAVTYKITGFLSDDHFAVLRSVLFRAVDVIVDNAARIRT